MMELVPRPWERKERLCGYSLNAPNTPEYCYHQECYEKRKQVKKAYKVARNFYLDPKDDIYYLQRPERLPDTYEVGPVTDQSKVIEASCMSHILEAFTDEEIRVIRDALGKYAVDPQSVFLWSMFDSISTLEMA